MLVLKMQICSSAIGILRRNRNITQILHLTVGDFNTGEILEEGRKLHPAEPSCIRRHEAEKRKKKKEKKTRNNLFHNQRESTICMQRL